MKSDTLLSSVGKGSNPKGKQLNVLEELGGVKPRGGLAQPASAGAKTQGNRRTHSPFLSLLTFAFGQMASSQCLADSWASWLPWVYPSPH